MAPKSKKVRIQLMIDREINELLDQLAERERRTKSAMVEIALLAWAKRTQAPEANG